MPRIPAELAIAVERAILDWAIREHFALKVTDPLPDADELDQDDVDTILAKCHTVHTIDDFCRLQRTH